VGISIASSLIRGAKFDEEAEDETEELARLFSESEQRLTVGVLSSSPRPLRGSSEEFSDEEIGLWVIGWTPILKSFFLMWVFQRFFISLSVRPGNWAAIFDHLQRIMKTLNSHSRNPKEENKKKQRIFISDERNWEKEKKKRKEEPVSKLSMETDYKLLFRFRQQPSLQIRSEII
jgi:hypothetical protein